MSQGLTWIAARRMPLVALVALLALAVGMLATVSSALALDAPRPDYQCLDDPDVTGTQLVVATPGTPATGTGNDVVAATPADPQHLNISNGEVGDAAVLDGADLTTTTCAAGVAAGESVYVARVTESSYAWSATQDGPARLTLTLSDTDGIIPNDGSGISVTVNIEGGGQTNNESDITVATLEWIRVSGALDGREPTGETGIRENIDSVDAEMRTFEIVVPKGTTEGEYTVSALVSTYIDADNLIANPDATPPVVTKTLSAETTFTVGDAGDNVAFAELALAAGELANVGAGTAVTLELSISNSLGNPSNLSATTTANVVIIAAGGDVTRTKGFTDNDATGNKVRFTVTKTTPGTIDVKALVVGTGVVAETDTVTLSFAGAVDSLSLSEPTSTLLNQAVGTRDDPATTDKNEDDDPRDSLTLTLTATDVGDNPVSPARVPNSAISIKDTNGDNVGTSKIGRNAAAPDKNAIKITLTSEGSAAAPLDAGDYTITVSSGGKKAEGSFTVASGAADISLAVASVPDPAALGSVLTVTATVTDESGLAVGNGTLVTFSTGGALKLDAVGSIAGIKTKGGDATVRFIVSQGTGLATIIADAGSATGTTTVALAAAEEEVVEVADVEPVDGLSQTELNNFASWSGEGSVSASELLAGIAGATGVLFYDGDSWQRYGVTDGQVIPGSRDFTVRSGQTIWISG